MQSPCPTVSWGQRKNLVLLKVHLKDSKDHEISLTNNTLNFNCYGIGASGENSYKFSLNTFGSVSGEPSFSVTPAGCQIILKKTEPEEPWPRLTKEKVKLPWLRVDFDYLETEDADESEGADDEGENDLNSKSIENLMRAPKEMKKEMKKSLDTWLKMIYLFAYNAFQWLTFVAIFINLMITIGLEHMTEAFYVQSEFLFKLAHLVMWLEAVNAALKLTKGSVIPSVMQIGGRCLFLFVIIPNEPRLQSSLVVLGLFIAYCGVEIIRYPYYMVQVFGREWYPLSWLRYTIWIPLYPLGMFLEGVVLYLFVTHRAETLFEPEISNLAPLAMIPVFLLMLIADYTMLRYMWRQRVKKLTGSSSSSNLSRSRRGPARKPKTT